MPVCPPIVNCALDTVAPQVSPGRAHTRTVASPFALPVAAMAPSGDTATQVTSPAWPRSRPATRPSEMEQTCTSRLGAAAAPGAAAAAAAGVAPLAPPPPATHAMTASPPRTAAMETTASPPAPACTAANGLVSTSGSLHTRTQPSAPPAATQATPCVSKRPARQVTAAGCRSAPSGLGAEKAVRAAALARGRRAEAAPVGAARSTRTLLPSPTQSRSLTATTAVTGATPPERTERAPPEDDNALWARPGAAICLVVPR